MNTWLKQLRTKLDSFATGDQCTCENSCEGFSRKILAKEWEPLQIPMALMSRRPEITPDDISADQMTTTPPTVYTMTDLPVQETLRSIELADHYWHKRSSKYDVTSKKWESRYDSLMDDYFDSLAPWGSISQKAYSGSGVIYEKHETRLGEWGMPLLCETCSANKKSLVISGKEIRSRLALKQGDNHLSRRQSEVMELWQVASQLALESRAECDEVYQAATAKYFAPEQVEKRQRETEEEEARRQAYLASQAASAFSHKGKGKLGLGKWSI
jgi:hypothetical protein